MSQVDVMLAKDQLAEVLGVDVEKLWLAVYNRCHEVALHLVRSGVLGAPGPETCRVARGTAYHIGSQHSWVVLGDPYDGDTVIVDPTGWAWEGEGGEGVEIYSAPLRQAHQEKGYHPHGYYPEDPHIMAWGRPPHPREPAIGRPGGLSPRAKAFLDIVGPLDRKGWSVLFRAPLRGWPAKEILTACATDPRLGPIMAIDREGMATDLNPCEMYW